MRNLHADGVRSGHLDRFRCRRGEYRGRRLWWGSMIHHAGGPATSVLPITVLVIGAAFRALLVATASGPDATDSPLAATMQAAILLTSVASVAKKEYLSTLGAYDQSKWVHVIPPVRVRLWWTYGTFRDKTDATECRSTSHSGGLGGRFSGLPSTPSRIGRYFVYLL